MAIALIIAVLAVLLIVLMKMVRVLQEHERKISELHEGLVCCLNLLDSTVEANKALTKYLKSAMTEMEQYSETLEKLSVNVEQEEVSE